MIKNRMAKIVGSAMAAALIFGVVAPITANANAVEGNQTANVQEMSQYDMALEEIYIAIDLLDNADLTNVDNYNRMMAFTGSAQARLEGLESNEDVDSLYTFVEEVHNAAPVALRLMNDMQNLEQATGEDKEAWIDALNEAIIYARENESLNYTTISAATEFLHAQAGSAEEVAQNQETEMSEYDMALQEMNIAIDLLDNADLTNVDNYDRMMAFTGSAQARLEGLESNEHVDSLYTFVEQVHNAAPVALRLMSDMENLAQATGEDKEAWIDALNEAIMYARENNSLNYTTISAATEFLHLQAGLK